MSSFKALLDLHRDVEHRVRHANHKVFLSGWDVCNPFAQEFLGPLFDPAADSTSYQSYTSDEVLQSLLRQMHRCFDAYDPGPRGVLPGDGSTGLIASVFTWLFHNGERRVYYVPTMHDTFYYFFDLYGMNVRRAAACHPFEPGFSLELPEERTVLFVSDPTWYVGRALAPEVIGEVKAWQARTGSLVFVDGTWQYLQWGDSRHECSSGLDPDLTIRLVGPTKFLGLNGHRFSYLLLPERLFGDIADVHENLHGSTSVQNLGFARRAISVMTTPEHNRRLTNHVRDIYLSLVEGGVVETQVTPDCGLYCFARVRGDRDRFLVMGGEYYELDGYPDYVRINLLSQEGIAALADA
ncbi:MAG: aminotransferase class I/II-fold pyridoxal phosphate-dependent enzyme [Longimicrobiaceae bacterium]